LSYPEPVEVGLAVEALGRSSVRYRLGVFAKGAEAAAAEGFFVHVYVGRDTRRPVELPQEWRRTLEAAAG
jgi:acyl-CoA thioester hydrolase